MSDVTFENWMRSVNRAMIRISMLSADDIEDYDYWDCWDAGMEPQETARYALESAGFPLDDLA